MRKSVCCLFVLLLVVAHVVFAESVRINGSQVNVYLNYNSYQPGEVVGTVSNGQTYFILEEKTDDLVGRRFKIKFLDGQEGWVSSVYCDQENNNGKQSSLPAAEKKARERDSNSYIASIAKEEAYGMSDIKASFNPKTGTLLLSGNGDGQHWLGVKTNVTLHLMMLFKSLPVSVKKIKYTSYVSVENRFGEKTGRKVLYSITAFRSSFLRMEKSGKINYSYYKDFFWRLPEEQRNQDAENILYNLSHP